MRTTAMPLAACLLAGCVLEPATDYESRESAQSRAGDWSLPADVQRIGNRQHLAYDAAGPWDGGAHCGGGLLRGTARFGDFLLEEFPALRSYGGYSCRQNTADASQMSVHGTGRALDLFVPMDDGRADNDAGDPVANWLVTHSEDVGVQYIIWDRTDWGAHRDAPKTSDYGGPNPHIDHIHMELTDEGAAQETPWFEDPDGDGVRDAHDNCPEVANGGQVDVDDDGVGNACDNCDREANGGQRDSDHDGIGNRCDVCPDVANAGQTDTDGDGRGDRCDVCPRVADHGQDDLDGDGRGDACDDDDDGDDVADDVDDCPLLRNPGQRDTDGDGQGDACAGDDDGDGVLDDDDSCPRRADPTQADLDGDGRGDACDGDDDEDGVVDDADVCPEVGDPLQEDRDADGLGDACDPSPDDAAPVPGEDDAGQDDDDDDDGLLPDEPTDDDGAAPVEPETTASAPVGSGGCAIATAEGSAPVAPFVVLLLALCRLSRGSSRRRRDG